MVNKKRYFLYIKKNNSNTTDIYTLLNTNPNTKRKHLQKAHPNKKS